MTLLEFALVNTDSGDPVSRLRLGECLASPADGDALFVDACAASLVHAADLAGGMAGMAGWPRRRIPIGRRGKYSLRPPIWNPSLAQFPGPRRQRFR